MLWLRSEPGDKAAVAGGVAAGGKSVGFVEKIEANLTSDGLLNLSQRVFMLLQ